MARRGTQASGPTTAAAGANDGHGGNGAVASGGAGEPARPTANEGPPRVTALRGQDWAGAVKRTWTEFRQDDATDWAAALTYYGVLSLFPGLLLLVSVLGLAGQSATTGLLDNITKVAPNSVGGILHSAIGNLQHSHTGTAGILAVVGLVGALWSASGYVAAFMRAANAIYDVPEGRPIWMKLPVRLGITVVAGVILVATLVGVVFTGRLAADAGKALGLGSGVVTVWDIAKWPVIVIMISLLFALLYWAAPNARSGGFRWISPGSILAVVIWLIASAGFAFYVANFGHYNKTYGSVAAVIIFLAWMWISNVAILLGAEFDAEIQRGRAIAAGHPPTAEPYLELRDTRKISNAAPQKL